MNPEAITGASAEWVAGVDEAGRGPLAGPVTAAAVILGPNQETAELRDSKSLSPHARERTALAIKAQSLACALGWASPQEIDELNILQATLLAMRRAVEALPVQPARVIVDGTHCPSLSCPVAAFIKGDSRWPAISAASILAKVARDEEMCRLDAQYPGYGFATHKGYPTASHREALRRLGAAPIHRRSFAPVRAALQCAGSNNLES